MKYSNTALKELKKRYKNILIKCALINMALFLAVPSSANANTTLESRTVINENTTYNNLSVSNIQSTSSNNGGVFYLENVQNVTLTFDGTTNFSGNSIIDGGMGGVIGNGWLSTKDSAVWSPFTPGGKIVFNGETSFSNNSTNNENGAGAIFNYGIGTTENPDILFNEKTTFSQNKSTSTNPKNIYPSGGGAIHHRGGAIVFKKDASFTGNESGSRGGAILSIGDIIFKGATSFTDNKAGSSGGAIAALGGNITFNGQAEFINNTATTGSAIASDGEAGAITFNDHATFKNNTGTAVLWNNGKTREVYFNNGATFDSNTNTLNGTLQNAGSVYVTNGDFTLTNNTGSNGGALKNSGTILVDTTGEINISNNETSSSAGAFDNGGNVSFSASKIIFSNNKAVSNYGGAIFNNGTLNILGNENIFSNNTADETNTTKSGGGAIHNRSSMNTALITIGTSDSINTFESNSSNAHGGAILSRAVDGESESSKVIINGTTTFTQNKAQANGGAVWNYVAEKNGTTGTSTFETNGTTTFENNTAEGLGGAIYNNSLATFNGTTIFKDNSDSTGANDIYNDGTITFNGDVTLDGGISGNGSVTFAKGSNLTAELNKTTILANSVTFEGNNIFNLTIANGMAEAEYDFITSSALNGKENVNITENAIYNLELTDAGKIKVSVKSGEEIAKSIDTPISSQEANEASAILKTNGNGTDLGKQLANKISEAIQSGNSVAAIQALKDIAPSTSQVISGIAKEASTTISRISGIRMDSIKGRSGGDTLENTGLWAQGLYNHTKQDSTSSSAGFKANSHGLAIGLDKEIVKHLLLGIGYGYLHTDADSLGQDIEVDGHNFFVYGKYQPTRWYVSSVLNYNFGRYTHKKSPFGILLKSKYNVNSWGAQVLTGYALPSGFTTEIGLRYLYVDAESYFDGIQRIRSNTDDVLTAVAGVKYQHEMYRTSDFSISPTLHLAATYDLISDNSTANVLVLGGGNYRIDTKRLHRFGVEAGAGITATIGHLDLTLEYNGAFRKDYDSQGGILRARYNF